tara:strand:+ start:1255 stop:2499 length:1245 start_codon:yes stop_codon:yes gene_type:complete
MNQGIMALQNSGRGEDTRLAHLMQGEVVVPPHILARNKSLKKALERHLAKTGTNLSDITVGSGSINPNTGLEEFGFLSKLWKKVKKVIDPIAQVASVIPGPWQPAAAIYTKGKSVISLAKGEGGIGDLVNVFTGPSFKDSFETIGARKGNFFDKLIGDKSKYTLGNIGDSVKSALGFGQTVPTAEAEQAKSFLENMSPEELTQYKATNPEAYNKYVNLSKQTTSAGFKPNILTGDPNYNPETGVGQSRLGMIEDYFKRKAGKLGEGIGKFEDKTGFNPALLALAKYYGDATEKALEKESGGMGDIRQSIRPDLAYSTYGGIGGFDLGFAEGGEVMDMRSGGESIGPGTGTSDDIPAMLSDGEFVMTAKANLGAGSVGLKKGKGGIMELVPQGEPDRQRGADNMMKLMRYFEAKA